MARPEGFHAARLVLEILKPGRDERLQPAHQYRTRFDNLTQTIEISHRVRRFRVRLQDAL